jgi:hypothetical protein
MKQTTGHHADPSQRIAAIPGYAVDYSGRLCSRSVAKSRHTGQPSAAMARSNKVDAWLDRDTKNSIPMFALSGIIHGKLLEKDETLNDKRCPPSATNNIERNQQSECWLHIEM